jgi:hypothetical protein
MKSENQGLEELNEFQIPMPGNDDEIVEDRGSDLYHEWPFAVFPCAMMPPDMKVLYDPRLFGAGWVGKELMGETQCQVLYLPLSAGGANEEMIGKTGACQDCIDHGFPDAARWPGWRKIEFGSIPESSAFIVCDLAYCHRILLPTVCSPNVCPTTIGSHFLKLA